MPTLGYHDIRCLAEPIRLMLEYMNIKFEDKLYRTGDAPTYARPEWNKDKCSLGLDFPNLPYWIDGTTKITESWAIMKCVSRRHKMLYPENSVKERKCDLLQGRIEDFRYVFINMCYSKTEKSFDLQKESFLINLPERLIEFESFLMENEWLTGDKIMYVDFAFCECLDQIRLFWPSFLKNHTKIENYLNSFDSLKPIVEYRESSRYHRFPINSKYSYWGGKVTGAEPVII